MNCQCNNTKTNKTISTKSKILDQVWKLFSHASFFNLSMREIAQTLGLAKSALYYHFRNKTDLFKQVIENRLGAFKIKFDTSIDKKLTPSQKLRKILKIYINEVEQEKKLIRLVYSDLPSFDKSIAKIINNFRTELTEKLTLIIKDGIKKGEFRKNTDPCISATLLLNSMENSIFSKNINKNNLSNQIIKILLYGIQKYPQIYQFHK